jgi:hypothetical protein
VKAIANKFHKNLSQIATYRVVQITKKSLMILITIILDKVVDNSWVEINQVI